MGYPDFARVGVENNAVVVCQGAEGISGFGVGAVEVGGNFVDFGGALEGEEGGDDEDVEG